MQTSSKPVAGRYEVGERIGRGELGTVFAARAPGYVEPLAIKFLDGHLVTKSEACARFFHAARIMAGLSGRKTPRVYDVGTAENGLPFVVMSRGDGESLRQRVMRLRSIPVYDLVPVVRDVCDALGALHAMGLLHQDVKPDDVFLLKDGAWLMGFGLVAPLAEVGKAAGVVGTPYFLAPERLQAGSSIDLRADLWSLGAVVYFAVTGMLPFEAPSMPELFERILEGPLPVPSRVAPHVPHAFDAWFARACARNRGDRFETAMDMALSLSEVLSGPVTVGFGALPHDAFMSKETPCRSCGEPVRSPPMVFCPACGVRISVVQTASPPMPADMPVKTGVPPMPADAVPAAAAPAPAVPATEEDEELPPTAPPSPAEEEPIPEISGPPTTPAPAPPSLALSDVDSYAPPEAPSPEVPLRPRPSEPTVSVEVPVIPRAAVRTSPPNGSAEHTQASAQNPAPTRPPPPPASAPKPPPGYPSEPSLQIEVAVEPLTGPASSDRPSSWLFRARLGPYRRGELVAARFSGPATLAVSPSRVAVSHGSGWQDVHLDAKIDLSRVRNVCAAGPGAFFLLGTGGLAVHVTISGECEFWSLDQNPTAPIAASEVTFHHALVEPQGVTFVGERKVSRGTTGFLAKGNDHAVRIVAPQVPATRLRCVTRLAGGELVACGAGTLVAFEGDSVGKAVEIAPGELYQIAPYGEGALVVGSGAYAFSVTHALRAELEEVQTTSDLWTLAENHGVGWAGSARGARILRRTPGGGVWTRLTGNLGTEAGVLALAPSEREVLAVLDDGTFVTGTLGS